MVVIYTLSDPETGEIRYVGKTNNISKRYYSHIYESINNSKKTHKESWIFSLHKKGLKPLIEILDECLVCDWEWVETMWIGLIKSWGFNLTNIGYGGEGVLFTPEVISKMRNAKLGVKFSEETKIKMSKTRQGFKFSKESIDKMRKSRIGFKFSKETKIKMSKTRKGKKLGPQPSKYRKIDQLTMCGKYIKTWKCVNDILEVYPWCKVSEVASGKRKSSHGYKWVYNENK